MKLNDLQNLNTSHYLIDNLQISKTLCMSVPLLTLLHRCTRLCTMSFGKNRPRFLQLASWSLNLNPRPRILGITLLTKTLTRWEPMSLKKYSVLFMNWYLTLLWAWIILLYCYLSLQTDFLTQILSFFLQWP